MRKSAEYIAGMREAIRLMMEESHDLDDICEGYREAQRTGKHSGRKIPARMAKQFARNFYERADAIWLAQEHISTIVDKMEADA